MRRSVKIAEIVHAVALGVWIGVLITSAAAAAVIFPAMREMDPTLGAYPAFQGDHVPLAGGLIAAKVFLFSDVVGFVCLLLAGLGTVVWAMSQWALRPKPAAIRATLILAMLIVFGFHLIVHGSKLNEESRLYWAAAEAGQAEIAEQHRVTIRDMHPLSRNLMTVTAGLALVTLVTGLWCVATPPPPKGRPAASGETAESS